MITNKNTYKLSLCFVGVFITFLLLESCKQKKTNKAQYTITQSKELNNADFTDFIRVTDSIKLETTQESLIGIVSKIQITKDRIYILDNYITMSVFAFDLQGNFIEKFGQIGAGPGEYISINDFVVDEAEQQLLLLVEGRRIIFTDMEGNYKKTQNLEFPHVSYIFPVGNNYVLGNHVTSGDEYLLHVTNRQFEEIHTYLPIHPNYMKVARSTLLGYTGCNGDYLFTPILSPTIYKVNEEGCFPKYEFRFNEPFMLTDEKIAKLDKEDEFQIVERSKSFFSLKSFFDSGDRLFVSFFLNKQEYWGAYHHHTKVFEYVDQNKITANQAILPKDIHFLSQIDRHTLIAVLRDQRREEKELNPMILICSLQMKENS